MATFGKNPTERTLGILAVWVIGVFMLLVLFTLVQDPARRDTLDSISYSQFLTEIDAGKVRDALIQGNEIYGNFNDGRGGFRTYIPYNDPTLIPRLYGKNVTITGRPASDNAPWFVSLAMSWLPFIVLIIVWIVLSRRMQKKN